MISVLPLLIQHFSSKFRGRQYGSFSGGTDQGDVNSGGRLIFDKSGLAPDAFVNPDSG